MTKDIKYTYVHLSFVISIEMHTFCFLSYSVFHLSVCDIPNYLTERW